MTTLPTITDLQSQLQEAQTSSVELTREALQRIDDPQGEGSKAFTRVYHQQALAAAQASDTLRAAGLARSPIDGLPISVKDLFDVAGDSTQAGSVVLKNSPAAARNATIVQRLSDAGAVIIGKTTMTEFAFSGLGLNPHYGTPASPWDRETRRIPGGSSSGAGVSVADGMAVAAIGTDTGGSVRIPSAICGLSGFKPTARRVDQSGTLPLAFSLDSIGPLAASVECCNILDSILSGETFRPLNPPSLHELRFAIPDTVVFDGADDDVKAAFDAAIRQLRESGATVNSISLPEFSQLAHINRQGGLVCAEAWAWHRNLLDQHQNDYDPRVASRIMRGRDISSADYIDLLQARKHWISAVEQRLAHVDALLMPTIPVVPPRIADLQASDDAYFAANGLILRNPTLINFLDGCALSIPCHQKGQAPVGLMIAGPAMHDRQILNIGHAVQALLGRP